MQDYILSNFKFACIILYMKQVLMLNPSPVLSEFVKEKLTAAKVSVDVIQGRIDAFTKVLSILPHLIVITIDQDFSSIMEFMEKKRSNPNTAPIPVMAIGPDMNAQRIMGLSRMGIIKYFPRPLKMDTLIKSMGTILSTSMDLDLTPCIIETHKNRGLIVVETSQGLNLDKIAILKFHLSDLISNHDITHPKILLIFSNLQLSFVDGINLEKFFDIVIQTPHVVKKDVKVLTQDPFVKPFIDGHHEYLDIQVEDNLASLVHSLMDSASSDTLCDLTVEKLLSADKNTIPCHADLLFNADIAARKQKIQQRQS